MRENTEMLLIFTDTLANLLHYATLLLFPFQILATTSHNNFPF